ncbi:MULTISPECIES: Mu transposase C-terminal domain-containing protein [Rhizobium]|uniref:Mu transposase C-terminal domain-containing protein n=1 Tax=Rhizobium TaxID=379 RepID=UPI0007EA48FE|nr:MULTISPECIES: Mu transposase C-terminal domain-containing protein [Rhizobium]ANK92760.1 integrase family protein [Rhizobium sp. N6212]ANK98805.1 integrase family protein [Rhizobium sp. N621]ANL04933.1 integrase family protein [Rhizobium esperanzae]ANL10992.1 integrase family protein [Rhizobium sp. N1341]ANL23044.1 integrase family protein [Rhizobium sp. N113]
MSNEIEIPLGLREIQTIDDLGIHEIPEGTWTGLEQVFEIRDRTRIMVLDEDRRSYGLFLTNGYVPTTSSSKKMLHLVHTGSNQSLLLSDSKIAHLQSERRIRPLTEDPKKNLPGASLSYREEDIAFSEWKTQMIDAIIDEEVKRGRKLTWKQMQAVMVKLGERIGKPPLGRSQTFDRLKQDREGTQFDRLLNQMPKPRPGNRSKRFHSEIYNLVREAVFTTIANLGTWKMVRSEVKRLVKTGEKYHHLRKYVVDVEGHFLLKQGFLSRTIKGCNLYVKDLLRHGPDYAQRVHADYLRTVRATAPLERVDADFVQYPVEIIDDILEIAFGKPWACVLTDRFTALPLGWSVGFGNPSFTLFLEALQHAIFEKTDLPEGMEYHFGGFPLSIGVDNEQPLIQKDAENAARQIGYKLVEYRPGNPWLKGSLERLFRTLGTAFIHSLAGATTSSPDKRKKFDKEKEMAVPVLKFSEFRGFLAHYFCNIHPYEPRVGLGETNAVEAVPADIWNEGIRKAPRRPLIDRDVFARLAGMSTMVTIQSDGVRKDYVHYSSPELMLVRTNPKHFRGKRYRLVRDPNDVGHVWLEDPYRNKMIELLAQGAGAKYAPGLRLFQHRRIMDYRREQNKKLKNALDLIEAQDALAQEILDLKKSRRKYDIARKVAQFFEAQVGKFGAARIIDMSTLTSGSDLMELANPETTRPKPPKSPRAKAVLPEAMRKPAKPAVVTEALVGDDDDADGYDV